MITKEQIMQIAFSKIANQEFATPEKFTAKQVGDIISVVALMVADPEPSQRDILYKNLVSYLKLPAEIQAHMLKEILDAREALIMALTVMSSDNPMAALKEMIEKVASDC